MQRDFEHLSEREKEVLRLLGRGHDAKSAAGALGVSVNGIHERLRDARRKLSVSSSREAARLLQDFEAHAAPKTWDEKTVLDFGLVMSPNPAHRKRQLWLALIGVGIMVLLVISAWVALGQASTQLPAATASAPAKVVSTTPAPGSIVKPGTILLSVTFDRPMLPGSMSFVQVSPETYPACDGRPVQSEDRRTYSMRCTVEPARSYEVWFNRPPYMNFRALDGTSAEPHQLMFTTPPR